MFDSPMERPQSHFEHLSFTTIDKESREEQIENFKKELQEMIDVANNPSIEWDPITEESARALRMKMYHLKQDLLKEDDGQ